MKKMHQNVGENSAKIDKICAKVACTLYGCGVQK